MKEIAKYNHVTDLAMGDHGLPFEGVHYQLLQCPSCEKMVLRQMDWQDGVENLQWKTIFPERTDAPDGLPAAIAAAHTAAYQVRNVNANAYGVLVGRLLDLVCQDRGAKGGTLNDRLKDLAAKGEIPDRLAEVAAGVRKLRNIGAHADLGDLTDADVPLLSALSRALLEYVYSAPRLVEKAEERLKELRDASRSGGTTP